MMTAKILHIDIETAPIIAYVWGLFKQNVSLDQIKQDWYMLCYAAKWHQESTVLYDALWLHKKEYIKDKTNDRTIVDTVWDLLDEADIVVAHNAQRFDVAKINAKFYEYGMLPPSPYKIVDTLKTSRAKFRFTSNKLDYIARLKSFGQKLKTDFDLWVDVMRGDKKQCTRMLDYNIQDVLLLEEVYTSMLPWMTNHPNINLFDDALEEMKCPRCGSTHIRKRGYVNLVAGKYQAYECKDCGARPRGRVNLLTTEQRKNIMSNIV